MQHKLKDNVNDNNEWRSTDEVYPIEFPNGCRVEPLETVCPDCQLPIEQEDVKHHIVVMHGSRSVIVNMRGYCRHCALTLTHHHRIKQHQNSVYFELIHKGEWISILPQMDILRCITEGLRRFGIIK